MINFKRLALTDLKIDIPRLAKKKVLREALETSGACQTRQQATLAALPQIITWREKPKQSWAVSWWADGQERVSLGSGLLRSR